MPWGLDTRGPFLKTSNQAPAGGRIYAFHNTILQPPASEGFILSQGCAAGLGNGGSMSNVTSRNNILHVCLDTGGSVNDFQFDPQGNYDYDLHNGVIIAAPGNEIHGVQAVPVYAQGPTLCRVDGEGTFQLASSSAGRDDGILLPNFNDGYTGSAPDVGAHEAGKPPMQFGVNADLAYAPPVVLVSPAPLSLETREAPPPAASANRFQRPAVFPNPFRPALANRLSFTSIAAGTRVTVHTVLGELVRELATEGTGGVSWDGNDSSGRAVASGVYLVRISGGGLRESAKVVVRR